jgi:hypothetical protein
MGVTNVLLMARKVSGVLCLTTGVQTNSKYQHQIPNRYKNGKT